MIVSVAKVLLVFPLLVDGTRVKKGKDFVSETSPIMVPVKAGLNDKASMAFSRLTPVSEVGSLAPSPALSSYRKPSPTWSSPNSIDSGIDLSMDYLSLDSPAVSLPASKIDEVTLAGRKEVKKPVIPLDVFWSCSHVFSWDILKNLRLTCHFLKNTLTLNGQGAVQLFEWIAHSPEIKIDGKRKSRIIFEQYKIALDPRRRYRSISEDDWQVTHLLQALLEAPKLLTWDTFLMYHNPKSHVDPLPFIAKQGLEHLVPELASKGFRLIHELSDDRSRRNYTVGDAFDSFYNSVLDSRAILNDHVTMEELMALDFRHLSCDGSKNFILNHLAKRRNFGDRFFLFLEKSINASILIEDSCKKILELDLFVKNEASMLSMSRLLSYVLTQFQDPINSFLPSFQVAWSYVVKGLYQGKLNHSVAMKFLEQADYLPALWKKNVILESINIHRHLVPLLEPLSHLETFSSHTDLLSISTCYIKIYIDDRKAFKKINLPENSVKSLLERSMSLVNVVSFNSWLDELLKILQKSISSHSHLPWNQSTKRKAFDLLMFLFTLLPPERGVDSSSENLFQEKLKLFMDSAIENYLVMVPFYMENLMKPLYEMSSERVWITNDPLWWKFLNEILGDSSFALIHSQTLSLEISDDILKSLLQLLSGYWNRYPMTEEQCLASLQKSLKILESTSQQRQNIVPKIERKMRTRKSGKFLRDLMMKFDPIISSKAPATVTKKRSKEKIHDDEDADEKLQSSSPPPSSSSSSSGSRKLIKRIGYLDRMRIQWSLIFPRTLMMLDGKPDGSAREWRMVSESLALLFPDSFLSRDLKKAAS